MNEKARLQLLFIPMSSPCAGFSCPTKHSPQTPPHNLTDAAASRLSTHPGRVQVLVARVTQVLHRLRVPPAFEAPVRLSVLQARASRGNWRRGSNQQQSAHARFSYNTTSTAMPTAPRPSLSATLIAMKFASERSAVCNFERDRCNLGLACLAGWREGGGCPGA